MRVLFVECWLGRLDMLLKHTSFVHKFSELTLGCQVLLSMAEVTISTLSTIGWYIVHCIVYITTMYIVQLYNSRVKC